MKTKTIELYEFDELSEGTKERVLDHERYINTEGFEWYDFTFNDWKERLESMGFENPDISFSGFYSQGDGASFTCRRVDVEKFLTAQKAKGRFKAVLKALKSGKIEANFDVERIDHRYSHKYTVQVNSEILFNDNYKGHDKDSVSLEFGVRDFILETVRTLSRKIYKELEAEYEGLTSDEAVIDTIKSNEYTFRANGEMENI